MLADFYREKKSDLGKPHSLGQAARSRVLWARREQLAAMRAQEKNRQAVGCGDLAQSLLSMITFIYAESKHIERELNDRIQIGPDLRNKSESLNSIPGLGQQSVAVLLSYLAPMNDNERTGAFAAFAGLLSRRIESGSSFHKSQLFTAFCEKRSLCPPWSTSRKKMGKRFLRAPPGQEKTKN